MTDHPFDLLGRELGEAARRRLALAPGRRYRRSRLRLLLVTAVAGLGITAAAWAAGSLRSNGDPVTYRYGPPASPNTHYGTVVAGSVELLTDDVPDPDGGLPWGARTFTTSRGYGCLQVGRVQEGKLGVLALMHRGSSAVSGRGLFHELRPAVLSQATTCLPLDGAGHAFLALHSQLTSDGVPASCLRPGNRTGACRGAGIRTIDVGLLGPRARSITFRAAGATHTVKTLGDAGGYLVVQRGSVLATRPQTFAGHEVDVLLESPIALSPASAVIRKVTYRGGPACVVRPTTNGRGACPDPPGFTPIPQPAAKDVRTTVRAFAAPDRRGIRLRFRARAAVVDGRSAYNVLVRFPRSRCPVRHLPAAERAAFAGKTCSGEVLGRDLERNVAAGALVETTIDLPSLGPQHRPALKPGVYRVSVSYRVQPPHPRITGSLAYPGAQVGRARIEVR